MFVVGPRCGQKHVVSSPWAGFQPSTEFDYCSMLLLLATALVDRAGAPKTTNPHTHGPRSTHTRLAGQKHVVNSIWAQLVACLEKSMFYIYFFLGFAAGHRSGGSGGVLLSSWGGHQEPPRFHQSAPGRAETRRSLDLGTFAVKYFAVKYLPQAGLHAYVVS